jgi:tRNA dimethylallyltransferase
MLRLDGRLPLDQAIGQVQQRTRRFAKRQWTWFRHEPDIEWMDLSKEETPAQAARRLEALLAR